MKRQLEVLFILILIFSTVLMMAWLFWPLLDADAMPCGPDKPGLDECAFIVKPSATWPPTSASAPAYVAPTPTATLAEPASAAYPAPATATQESGYPGPGPQPTATEWAPDPEATHPPTATPPDPTQE